MKKDHFWKIIAILVVIWLYGVLYFLMFKAEAIARMFVRTW